MVFEKNAKQNFSQKPGLPVKPEYPESRETTETFFPDSFHFFLIISLTFIQY